MLEIFTFGDSWTAGAGLLNPETDYFGSILANALDARVHNLGVEGSSVSGALNLLEENIARINAADSALVILTFTENARDIDCYSERPFDYIAAYHGRNFNYEFYNSVMVDIEQEWINRLGDVTFGENVTVVTGFNFVYHYALAEYCKQHYIFIDEPWIKLLGWRGLMPITTRASSLKTIHTLTNTPINDYYKKWVSDIAEIAIKLINWMPSNPKYFDEHDPGHPNVAGHRVWAERILYEL